MEIKRKNEGEKLMDATTIEQVQKMVRKLNRKSQKDLKNILKIALKDAKTIEEKNHILWIFSKSKISDEKLRSIMKVKN